MDNTLLSLDFFNDSYFVRSGTIEHTWFSKEQFLADTNFPFEDGLISLSYEPYKDFYLVDKRNVGIENGLGTPELAWVDENFANILEQGRLRRELETPVITVSLMRNIKLAETDWVLIRHQEETILNIPHSITTEKLSEVLTYRQALRDITIDHDPALPEDQITWPVCPI